jgi:hypothetical protein
MMPRICIAILLITLACCSRPPQSPLADLAARLPSDAIAIAGADLDRLRSSPLFPKLPEPFRAGNYVLAGYTGKDLVTATRSANRITVAGAPGQGAPTDLLQHAPNAQLWLVIRGAATLPLAGNLANINRLLHQTEYTVVTATPGADRVDVHAEAVCRTDPEAQHLEENIRAIASLTRFQAEVTRESATVRIAASVLPEALAKLF